MRDAVARHRAEAEASGEVLSGRFVCPLGRLGELSAVLDASGDSAPLDLALIVTAVRASSLSDAMAAVAEDERLRIACVEGPVGDLRTDVLAAVAALVNAAGVPCYGEIPVTGDWNPALDALAEAGLGAKLRCGGLRAELFPSVDQLGTVVLACHERKVAFKATAGLHHAVRHRDEETGFEHHGFVNLVLAACRAAAGAPAEDVLAVLGSTDAAGLARECRSLGPEEAAAGRALFVSYGSCSTSEPLEDLQLLGLAFA